MNGTGFELSVRHLIEATISLFIIMDPVGNVPIFMTLTHDKTREQRKKLFQIAVVTAYLLLLLFTFAGTAILRLFSITLADFQIAGGLLILAISMKILTVGYYISPESEGIGAVPLACPLLVGPGAITAAMVANGVYGTATTVAAATAAFVLTAAILSFAEGIYRLLGKTGSSIVSKIIAILIAAIAVQYIRVGISVVIKEFSNK